MTLTERQRRRRLLAAEGYLELAMAEHALAELDAIEAPGDLATADGLHRLRAEAFRALGQWQEALADFEACYAHSPTDVGVLMGLAWCYKRLDQLPKAIAAMHEARQADPKLAVVLYNLSCYYALAGNKLQALSWLGRSLRMDPKLRDLVDREEDFDVIRDDPDFARLLELTA
jgi:tetratricopeptide (TPR) repeat protein